MVDQDPLRAWELRPVTIRATPRTRCIAVAPNGAAQRSWIAAPYRTRLRPHADPVAALKVYEDKRLPKPAKSCSQSQCAARRDFARSVPPHRRQAVQEYRRYHQPRGTDALSESYKRVAGYDKAKLKEKA